MLTAPGLMAWCLLAVISCSLTLTLQDTPRIYVKYVVAGDTVQINCSLGECDNELEEDAVKLSMKQWTATRQEMTLVATLKTTRKMSNETNGLEIQESEARTMNFTGSQTEPLSLVFSTQAVDTGDVYQCDAHYWVNETLECVSCLTLLVTAPSTLPDLTADVTDHDNEGSPQTSPEDERMMTGPMSLLKIVVGMMGIVTLLMFAIMILNIVSYRKTAVT